MNVSKDSSNSLDDLAQRNRSKKSKSVHPALADVMPGSLAGSEHRGMDWVVFGISAALAVIFVAWGFISPAGLGKVATAGMNGVTKYFGWFLIVLASAFVIFVIWLAAGRYGNIPLGKDGEKPEYSTSSWIAMMFSAGMGIGLMFFGVSEPISHFTEPLEGTAEAGSTLAMTKAMATTMFHWGLHPWAMYAVVGIALAYGMFRRGRSSLFSDAFSPLFGRRTSEKANPAGQLIDTLAIFATLFGSATSLGLGALQIAKGLEIVAGIGKLGNNILVIIIAVLTVAFVLSAVSGISKGIQLLSNINMYLAAILAIFVFVVGPTVFILNILPTALFSYLGELPAMAARTGASGTAVDEWLSSWTVFYWAWWLSWTPFVGHFIAQISRGRTIRQFVTGVLLVPTLVSLAWFAIFGGTAIFQQRAGVDVAGQGGVEAQFFTMLDSLPLAAITSVLVMILVAIFFVSGADAASIVMGSITERGAIHPRRPIVIFWGVLTGLVAIVALVSGGEDALDGLQTLTFIAAIPFAIVVILLVVALMKDLAKDPIVVRRSIATERVRDAVVSGLVEHGDDFALVITDDVVPVSERLAAADRDRSPKEPTGNRDDLGGSQFPTYRTDDEDASGSTKVTGKD